MARIIGTPGDDAIHGTEGDDYIEGGDGNDFLHGRQGNDELRGGNGNDTLVGAEGNDTLVGESGHDLLVGGEGNDWLAYVFGGNDTLIGGEGNDRFDIFGPGAAHITLSGGEGVDEFIYAGEGGTVDLQAGTFVNTAGTTMTLSSIENVQSFSDDAMQIYGNTADNFIFSTNGDDTISGREGNDTIFGTAGDDLYVFDAAPGEANADFILFEKYTTEIHGFEEDDQLALDNHVMRELGAEGTFSADDERFYAAAGATGGAEADDRVIFDTEAGLLYYDADGSGGAEAQLIATVRIGGLDLVASDITVI